MIDKLFKLYCEPDLSQKCLGILFPNHVTPYILSKNSFQLMTEMLIALA